MKAEELNRIDWASCRQCKEYYDSDMRDCPHCTPTNPHNQMNKAEAIEFYDTSPFKGEQIADTSVQIEQSDLLSLMEAYAQSKKEKWCKEQKKKCATTYIAVLGGDRDGHEIILNTPMPK